MVTTGYDIEYAVDVERMAAMLESAPAVEGRGPVAAEMESLRDAVTAAN